MAWTRKLAGTAVLRSVVWTGTQLVAVGKNSAIYSSPDGTDWTQRFSASSFTLNSVAWTGSQLVAVGSDGAVLTSPDGITWKSGRTGSVYPLNSVAWTGSQLLAVGDGGAILTSQGAAPDAIPPGGRSAGNAPEASPRPFLSHAGKAYDMAGRIRFPHPRAP
jgi:photosystem II stability/assembly factor-like uncharacterized protein